MTDSEDIGHLDPDLDHCPPALRKLAEATGGRVTVIDEDGVGPAVLVLVPSVWRHAHELDEE